jgi:hypothetical protein
MSSIFIRLPPPSSISAAAAVLYFCHRRRPLFLPLPPSSIFASATVLYFCHCRLLPPPSAVSRPPPSSIFAGSSVRKATNEDASTAEVQNAAATKEVRRDQAVVCRRHLFLPPPSFFADHATVLYFCHCHHSLANHAVILYFCRRHLFLPLPPSCHPLFLPPPPSSIFATTAV